MAYKLQINEPNQNLKFNVKYENMARMDKPEVIAKAPDGSIVKERTIFQGNILLPGSTQKKWVDDKGNQYEKSTLTFWCGEQQVAENSQTKVMTIEGYQPEAAYTDQYVISAYYEFFPHDDDMKKDFDKDRARISNLNGMKKLWDYLKNNKLVARGEFCSSSKGFVASDGYIRAIGFGNKWGLELGVFKEEKIFQHLQEEVPPVPAALPQNTKRLKMV